jgi:hypothetical protein
MPFNSLFDVARNSDIQRIVKASNHVTEPNLLAVHHLTPTLLTDTSVLRVNPLNAALLYFLMPCVLPARIAELRRLKPLRMLAAILGRRVVPVFAIVALQCDDFSHRVLPVISAIVAHFRCAMPRNRLLSYSMISATAPAPTVCPPSRMANRNPFSKATGVINVISHEMLSPGITISTPSGNFTSPVTSVVRK